jgi:hypothetical protein
MSIEGAAPGTASEQRKHPRISIDAFVKVTGDDREFVFRTRDLSAGGLFLYTRVGHIYPFRVGDQLTLELYDYDRFVACKVAVARVVQEGSPEASSFPLGFGVHITEIDDENRTRLAQMLERAQSGQAPY